MTKQITNNLLKYIPRSWWLWPVGFFCAAAAAVLLYGFNAPGEGGKSVALFAAALLLLLLVAVIAVTRFFLAKWRRIGNAKENREDDSAETIESKNRLEEEIGLRKKAQEIAGQLYTELNQIFNAAGPLCVIDNNFKVTRVNHAFADAFGLDEDAGIMKCFDIWQSDKCNSDSCPLKKIARNEEVGEYILRSKNGNLKDKAYIVNPVPYHGADGELNGIVVSFTDITDRDEAERQARLHREQLIQADKMASLGVLVSGVAHEINNPNTFITLNAPLLKKIWGALLPVLEEYYESGGDLDTGGMAFPELKAMIPEILTGMEEGARRIDKIVTSLKDFARKEPAELDEDVDISRVVASALTLLNNVIRKSTNKFSVVYGPDIPTFKGKSQQIEQVVMNLLINACQALPDPDKGVSISTSYQQRKKCVVLTVLDEGNGIPEEIKKQIFDPFFTTKRDIGGTGLGLSISTTIVKEHKGSIIVDATPGKGTAFKVTIPAGNGG